MKAEHLNWFNYNSVYNLYRDLLYYVFCPENMQTVSLTEKIIKDASVVWSLKMVSSPENINLYEKVYNSARDYIAHIFDLQLAKEEIDFKYRKAPIDNLMVILKENARSKAVKDFLAL